MKLAAALALSLIAPLASLSALQTEHWWAAGPALPKLTGRVVDNAKLMDTTLRDRLAARLARLETRTGHQLVVVTSPGLKGEPIEEFGIRLGRTWGVGRKGVNDGVLFIIAPVERKVRIEVGYGLEKILTDPVCAEIIRQTVLPRFSRGEMAGGIEAGTGEIIERLERSLR